MINNPTVLVVLSLELNNNTPMNIDEINEFNLENNIIEKIDYDAYLRCRSNDNSYKRRKNSEIILNYNLSTKKYQLINNYIDNVSNRNVEILIDNTLYLSKKNTKFSLSTKIITLRNFLIKNKEDRRLIKTNYTKQEIEDLFIKKVRIVFENGSGKRNIELKNYTGKNLEELSRFAITTISDSIFGKSEYSIDGDYIKDNQGHLQDERLDDHLHYKDKIVMAGESRAWMDKPFVHMKYGVIFGWSVLPHIMEQIHEKCIFPILTFSYNIKQETFNTMQYVYPNIFNRIKIYNLSGFQRDASKDYFYRGYDINECKRYINDIYEHLLLIKNS